MLNNFVKELGDPTVIIFKDMSAINLHYTLPFPPKTINNLKLSSFQDKNFLIKGMDYYGVAFYNQLKETLKFTKDGTATFHLKCRFWLYSYTFLYGCGPGRVLKKAGFLKKKNNSHYSGAIVEIDIEKYQQHLISVFKDNYFQSLNVLIKDPYYFKYIACYNLFYNFFDESKSIPPDIRWMLTDSDENRLVVHDWLLDRDYKLNYLDYLIPEQKNEKV